MASYQFFCFGVNNNMLFINFAVQNHHDGEVILGFAIPILLTLVQIRYPAEDLFRTHPITITVFLSSLFAHCLSLVFGVLIRQRHGHNLVHGHGHSYPPRSYWYRIAERVFGLISVASLLSLLFPHFYSTSWLQPLPYVFFIFLLLGSLVRKLYRRNQVMIRRARPILPLSFMDLHLPRPTRIVSSEANDTIPMNENDLWFCWPVNDNR